MGYFDADAEDMLEVYLLETRQLTGQLSAVLLEAEKKNAFAEEDIHSIFRIMHTDQFHLFCIHKEGIPALVSKINISLPVHIDTIV